MRRWRQEPSKRVRKAGGALNRRAALARAAAVGGVAVLGTAWVLVPRGADEEDDAVVAELSRAAAARAAASRGESIERLRALSALDGGAADGSGTTLLEPPRAGELMGTVVVLFHGLGSAPPQFVPLAERLVARGAVALIPRLPRHGLRNRMTDEPAGLSVAELVRTASEAVDIAWGLGERVAVAGLSLGGVLALWVAQTRPVARAVAIAPAIGLPPLPLPVSRAVFALARRLPNQFIWWDGTLKENVLGPTYAYPRFATRALARVQRLGFALLDGAAASPPRAREVWLVTNELDRAVDSGASALLAERWRVSGAVGVRSYVFPSSVGVEHDLVDAHQPYARTEAVYPVLERIIGEGLAP